MSAYHNTHTQGGRAILNSQNISMYHRYIVNLYIEYVIVILQLINERETLRIKLPKLLKSIKFNWFLMNESRKKHDSN